MLQAQTENFLALSIPRCVGKYIMMDVIGCGATSVVVEAVDSFSGKHYAVKVLSTSDFAAPHRQKRLEVEIKLAHSLKGDHICQFVEVITEGDLVFIVMECYEGGDLFSFIQAGHTRSKSDCLRAFADVAVAVRQLHELGYAHGDIKPENVIVDAVGNMRLIDFGYAKEEIIGGDADKCGTFMYAAPELLTRGSFHTHKADVWALGIMLFVMATGRFPYTVTERSAIARTIGQGRLTYPSTMDPQIRDLIMRMTKVNPNERPKIDDVLSDPMFDEFDTKKQTEMSGDGEMEREMALNSPDP
jgi:serine/threonine protein kinase